MSASEQAALSLGALVQRCSTHLLRAPQPAHLCGPVQAAAEAVVHHNPLSGSADARGAKQPPTAATHSCTRSKELFRSCGQTLPWRLSWMIRAWLRQSRKLPVIQLPCRNMQETGRWDGHCRRLDPCLVSACASALQGCLGVLGVARQELYRAQLTNTIGFFCVCPHARLRICVWFPQRVGFTVEW